MRTILVKALLLVLVINAVGLVLVYMGASAGAADVTFGAAAPILKRSLLISFLAAAGWIGVAAGVRGSEAGDSPQPQQRRASQDRTSTNGRIGRTGS